MKRGNFWPTEEARQPIETGFYVPRSPLIRAEGEAPILGMSHIVVTEDSQAVEKRLREQFPLYRLAQFGKVALGIKGARDEI